jgi:hypothetical protein
VIYHGNRMKVRTDADPEEVARALDVVRAQGREIPSVKSFIVGREHGEFDWSAVFVLEDLDGYREYLDHPAHRETERLGLRLMESLETFDITDDLDPEFPAKVAEIQRLHYAADPELTSLMSTLGSHTGPSAVDPTAAR